MQVNERRRDYNAKRALKGGIVLKEFLARTVGRYDVPFYNSWSVLQCGYTDCCAACLSEVLDGVLKTVNMIWEKTGAISLIRFVSQ